MTREVTTMQLRARIPCGILALWATAAPAAHISIAAGPECYEWSWEMVMVPPGPYALHVKAWIDGAITGITGAEFRITGLPAGWTAFATPAPDASTSLGDPLDGSGANIAFATCQTSTCRVLDSILVFPTTVVGETFLSIRPRTPPTNPAFNCPRFVLCDAPVYSSLCVPGGVFCINVTSGRCQIGMESTAWSAVKAFYR
jgi:hypothetical protein